MRLEISEYAAAGLNDTDRSGSRLLCVDGTQVATTRQSAGTRWLAKLMGRPATGPVSTFPHALLETMLRLRKLHPGWGPATLLAALQTDPYWRDQPLPSTHRDPAQTGWPDAPLSTPS